MITIPEFEELFEKARKDIRIDMDRANNSTVRELKKGYGCGSGKSG